MDAVHVYRDDAGEWRWRRLAANGNVVADSGEGYANKGDCLAMARKLNTDDVGFLIEDDEPKDAA